jgi:hypothetical protein
MFQANGRNKKRAIHQDRPSAQRSQAENQLVLGLDSSPVRHFAFIHA